MTIKPFLQTQAGQALQNVFSAPTCMHALKPEEAMQMMRLIRGDIHSQEQNVFTSSKYQMSYWDLGLFCVHEEFTNPYRKSSWSSSSSQAGKLSKSKRFQCVCVHALIITQEGARFQTVIKEKRIRRGNASANK